MAQELEADNIDMSILIILSVISAFIIWACCKVSKLSPKEEEKIDEYINNKHKP